ncbi:MAG: hypothetical protein AAF517_04145 [Planctomycetota bacterium]
MKPADLALARRKKDSLPSLEPKARSEKPSESLFRLEAEPRRRGGLGIPPGPSRKRSQKRGRRSTYENVPWVKADRWAQPKPDQFVERIREEMPPWRLFDPRYRHELRPDHVRSNGQDLFHAIRTPEPSSFSRAFQRVVRRKGYSEVRRFFKRGWRRHWNATPTLSYDEYLSGLEAFNSLGRTPDELDYGNSQHFSNEFRNDLFGQGEREGERDFEIFSFGPLVVMDSGSVRLDLGRAIQLGSAGSRKSRAADNSILSSKEYSVSTSLRLGFDPIVAAREDPTWILDRYGVNVQVTWFSDVLAREALVTGLEVEWERNGEFAALFNIVFKSR